MKPQLSQWHSKGQQQHRPALCAPAPVFRLEETSRQHPGLPQPLPGASEAASFALCPEFGGLGTEALGKHEAQQC